ncbi:hypothetical protein CKAH01_05548 [Colletotrichum kahawae]|uniref:Uncharacterized protein n=1 Tax=Colletotrichum kahawae TaxID=34407 RepID=A0AAE0D4W5_COLKA|nr:hypothetical protein CKAH01_05548 [Colletotrichum kahawae]
MSVSHPGPERTASLYITHKEQRAANCNALRNHQTQHPYRLITSIRFGRVSSKKPRTSSPTNVTETCPIATPSPTWGVSCLVSKTSLPQLELPVVQKPGIGNRRHFKALTALPAATPWTAPCRRLTTSSSSSMVTRTPQTPRGAIPQPLLHRGLGRLLDQDPSNQRQRRTTTTTTHHLSLQLHGTESVACLLLLLLLSASVIIPPLRPLCAYVPLISKTYCTSVQPLSYY